MVKEKQPVRYVQKINFYTQRPVMVPIKDDEPRYNFLTNKPIKGKDEPKKEIRVRTKGKESNTPAYSGRNEDQDKFHTGLGAMVTFLGIFSLLCMYSKTNSNAVEIGPNYSNSSKGQHLEEKRPNLIISSQSVDESLQTQDSKLVEMLRDMNGDSSANVFDSNASEIEENFTRVQGEYVRPVEPAMPIESAAPIEPEPAINIEMPIERPIETPLEKQDVQIEEQEEKPESQLERTVIDFKYEKNDNFASASQEEVLTMLYLGEARSEFNNSDYLEGIGWTLINRSQKWGKSMKEVALRNHDSTWHYTCFDPDDVNCKLIMDPIGNFGQETWNKAQEISKKMTNPQRMVQTKLQEKLKTATNYWVDFVSPPSWAYETVRNPNAKPVKIEYEIKEKDTLSQIAKDYDIPLKKVIRDNQGIKPNKIRAGNKIYLIKESDETITRLRKPLAVVPVMNGKYNAYFYSFKYP